MDRADSPFVQGETSDFWERYRHLGSRRRYPADAFIYQQGQHSSQFFYLLAGRVKVYVARPDGFERVLAYMGPSTVFGESACFDGRPYYASAVALLPCEVYCFDRDTVFAAMAGDPTLAAELFKGVVRKQRLLASQVESMSFLSVPARLALMLCRLAGDYGLPEPQGGGKRLALRLTHEEIAQLLGTSRVTISREIGALVRAGILRSDKRELIVLDEQRLWQLAMPS